MKNWVRVALPNVFTLGSIFCGVSAIFYCIDGFNALTGDPGRAPWLIIAAALLDSIDGKVARYSQGATRFGIELDSLADVISFGVAPMVLVYTLKPFGEITWVLCLLFLMCGAIRLARYNVMTLRRVERINQEKDDFMGLPIPTSSSASSSTGSSASWSRSSPRPRTAPSSGWQASRSAPSPWPWRPWSGIRSSRSSPSCCCTSSPASRPGAYTWSVTTRTWRYPWKSKGVRTWHSVKGWACWCSTSW